MLHGRPPDGALSRRAARHSLDLLPVVGLVRHDCHVTSCQSCSGCYHCGRYDGHIGRSIQLLQVDYQTEVLMCVAPPRTVRKHIHLNFTYNRQASHTKESTRLNTNTSLQNKSHIEGRVDVC